MKHVAYRKIDSLMRGVGNGTEGSKVDVRTHIIVLFNEQMYFFLISDQLVMFILDCQKFKCRRDSRAIFSE
jgi:hypothetical protein